MSVEIVADSGCDSSAEIREELDLELVPLTIMVPNHPELKDDIDLDTEYLLDIMNAEKEPARSACASIDDYAKRMLAYDESVFITLSQHLSGSYNTACVARDMVLDICPEKKIHIFDSKSASAGELLLVAKLRECIQMKMPYEHIVQKTNQFIDSMKTYFVLERYDNLINSGRLSHLKGKLISFLKINLVMGSDGDGNIALFGKTRGSERVIERMLGFIKNSGRETKGENMVITHCNNPSLAETLKAAVKSRYNFKNIFVLATKGTSSLYANEKGIIMAF